MTKSTHKLPKLLLRPVIKVVMFALLLCFGSGAALAQTRAYVTNAQSNSVSVIDTATFSVIATVPVGSSPSAVAVTPNGRFAYVANFFEQLRLSNQRRQQHGGRNRAGGNVCAWNSYESKWLLRLRDGWHLRKHFGDRYSDQHGG